MYWAPKLYLQDYPDRKFEIQLLLPLYSFSLETEVILSWKEILRSKESPKVSGRAQQRDWAVEITAHSVVISF